MQDESHYMKVIGGRKYFLLRKKNKKKWWNLISQKKSLGEVRIKLHEAVGAVISHIKKEHNKSYPFWDGEYQIKTFDIISENFLFFFSLHVLMIVLFWHKRGCCKYQLFFGNVNSSINFWINAFIILDCNLHVFMQCKNASIFLVKFPESDNFSKALPH